MNKRRMIQKRLLIVTGTVLALLAVLGMVGGHLLALQSVAWVRMINQFAQEGSLASALAKTFDGQHPCALCRIVQASQQQEQAKKIPGLESKPAPELLCEASQITVPLPSTTTTETLPYAAGFPNDFREPPPVPPPRPPRVRQPVILDFMVNPARTVLVENPAPHPQGVQRGAPGQRWNNLGKEHPVLVCLTGIGCDPHGAAQCQTGLTVATTNH